MISRFRAYDVLCLAGHIHTGPGSVVLFLMVGGSAYGSTRCASACEIFITQPSAAIGLALMQRLRMHRHLRLCLGLRLSQQAEGDVGIMELLDPGAGGFMDNGHARAP